MNKLVFIALVLLNGYFLVAEDTDVQQQLKLAEAESNIFLETAGPFQMEVDFVVQNQIQGSGHLTYKWQGKDKWWRKVTMAGYEEIDIRNGDKELTVRNIGFTPARLKELESLIDFPKGLADLQGKKQKQRSDLGIQVHCVQAREREGKQTRELCVNPVTHDLISDAWNELPDNSSKRVYSEQTEFSGHRYPRKMELLINGSRAVSAQVVSLTSSAVDQSLLIAPPGAIERRKCEGIKHPIPLSTPDPPYPSSNRQNRLTGDTTVAMTVLTDGSVENIQLIGRSAQEMDKATMKALQEWRFKPAMCGTEPVIYDIEVVVSFRLAP